VGGGHIRSEKDTLGEIEVPEEAYYGPQTVRAINNFKVSRQKLPPSFIRAQAAIKLASARANLEADKLEPKIAKAIISAASEVREGKFEEQFVVDVFQSGAGTSQNMNANEVIANRALEIMGYEKGRYDIIHPNDHVNMSQSSNDTTHTAIHIAAVETMNAELMPALVDMLTVFSKKAAEFMDIVKPRRTHLQDAVPVTLAQEFSGYARMLELGIKRLERSVEGLWELNMGGTAVGTGLNIPENFSNIAIREVRKITGQDFELAENPFEATQAAEAILGASAALRSIAVSLIKIANDLRLLSSGPRTGIGEINLPAVQPGSSIMPGKVNPVMAEMLNMACFQIIGNDSAITMAAQGGQFELNVFTPLLAYDLLNSIEILTGATTSFTERCLRGITVNRDRCEKLSKQSLALVTILATRIGYEEAANIAHIAHVGGKTIIETVKEMRIMDEKDAEELLDPLKMTGVKQ